MARESGLKARAAALAPEPMTVLKQSVLPLVAAFVIPLVFHFGIGPSVGAYPSKVLLDIEELNRRAHHGEFDLTKLSVGAFAAVGNRYQLLRSGAALGHGVGPLVVTRTPMSLAMG